MDSFDLFISIFKRCIAEKNYIDLTTTLKDSRKYFQNISVEDSHVALRSLFHPQNGLLSFLNNQLTQPSKYIDSDNATKEGFHLLEFIMEQFPLAYEPYIEPTKDVCQRGLMIQHSVYIQKAACNAFRTFITKFNEYDIAAGEIVKTFIKKLHVFSIRERSFIFLALSIIVRYCSEVKELSTYSELIFKYLRNDFKSKYKPNDNKQAIEIQCYLDAYTEMLETYTPSDDISEEYYQDMYNWIKDLSNPNKYSHRKTIMRSAIDLLSRHIHLFRENIYNDYKMWYDLFVKLAKERGPNGICGQRALRSFYKTISYSLKHKDSAQSKELLLHFKDTLKQQITSAEIDAHELRLIVYGFSQMAAPCKKYLGDDDIKEMYTVISHCTIPILSREDVEHVHFENIYDYQEALSEILSHASYVSLNQLTTLIKLSTLLIKRYPDLSVLGKKQAVSSLIKTIANVRSLTETLFDEFLYNVVHDGIIWSCSHTLFVDAELQRGLQNLKETPRSYKDYLPLWLELSNPDKYKGYDPTAQIVRCVFDKLINVCIVLMNKLNVNIKTKENNIFSDIMMSQTAVNEADFKIYVNMVDLYVNIIEEVEPVLLTNTSSQFLYETIRLSYKHPLISGYYKLIHIVLKTSSVFQDAHTDRNSVDDETYELVRNFFLHVLDLIHTFSHELLFAGLYLILDAPLIFVKDMLNKAAPIYSISFTMGLTDFDLACTALDALEKWTRHLESRCTKEFLQGVLPSLEPYLQSKESTADLLQDILKTQRKVITQVTLLDSEKSLNNFQRRILLLLGSLDSDVILDFLHNQALDTQASWDKKDLIKYTMSFPDLEVDMYLDKILPRLLALSQNSGDRRTKVVACEVLHAVVTMIFGKTAQHLSDMDRFAVLYEKLCPILLNLGCDTDEVTQQLYQPLMMQLTHWLSSRHMLRSPMTASLIESLFDGLCNHSNSSIRDFSGMCLTEFVDWSIRQSDAVTSDVNIHAIMRKITNFALHPSLHKRIAAAVAFNHLYKILHEEEEIVLKYWLELLYCFVKSLEGCNDPSVNNAIEHVERVVREKSELFISSDERRRKPPEFKENTLTAAIHWLLTKCASSDEDCRTKCMQSYIRICNSFETAECMINLYIDTHGLEGFNEIILKDIPLKVTDLSAETILPFLKTLDCYNWLLQKELVDPLYLFNDTNPKRDVVFNTVINVVHLLNQVKMEIDSDVTELSKSVEELQTLRFKAIKMILDFMYVMFYLHDYDIPKNVLNRELFELICKCVMCPHDIGFSTSNIEMAESLPSRLEKLLTLIAKTMRIRGSENTIFDILQKQFTAYIDAAIFNIFDLEKVLLNDKYLSLKQSVNGLTILRRSDIFAYLRLNEKYAFNNVNNTVEKIFKFLTKEHNGNFTCIIYKPATVDYLKSLMELLLINYESSLAKKLVTLATNSSRLDSSKTTEIKYGEYFLNIFKDVIFKFMLKDITQSVIVLTDSLQENPVAVLEMLESFLLFVQRRRMELQDSTQSLANAIIRKFVIIERAVKNIDSRKQKLIDIYGIAVRLMWKPTDVFTICNDFYRWILHEIMNTTNIEYKTHMLKNFLICLTDTTVNEKPEIMIILCTLRNDRLSICTNNSSDKNLNVLKIVNCFQTLLTLLSITGSLELFVSIIHFSAGDAKYLYDDKLNEHLKKYFACISSECALKSLQRAYNLFMDYNHSKDYRFDVLHKFLHPSFEYCKTKEIELFFEKNIKEIYSIILQNFSGTDVDIEQLTISKIACYDLIAVMFVKIPLSKIVDANSVITRNAIDNVQTGRELLQQLYRSTLEIRKLKNTNPQHKEIRRLLQCAAYNCSIAIVSLKSEEKFYLSVFGENKQIGQFIWQNIIDCDRQYNFRQTVNEYPKQREKLVNIRKNVKSTSHPMKPNYPYISSYNLATSTLCEDMNAYDLNQATILPENDIDQEKSMKLLFECDDLNDHECMASICGILTHVVSSEIFGASAEVRELPRWLKGLHTAMLFEENNNIMLFLIKVILNTQTIFQPYAKHFLMPIIYALTVYIQKQDLNYIVTDALMMLIDWRTVAIPKEDLEEKAAKKLLTILIDKIIIKKPDSMSRIIYNYNINILKTLIEVWQMCLEIPQTLNEKMITAPDATVDLILTCLGTNMRFSMIQRNDVIEFLQNLLKNWRTNEGTVLQSCEALGIILRDLEAINDSTEQIGKILESIRSVLQQMQHSSENTKIKCIRSICKNYPEAATEYSEFVTTNMHKMNSLSKAHCLEIFSLLLPTLTKEHIVRELGYMKFRNILLNKIAPCDKVALQIVRSLTSILTPSDINELAEVIVSYSKSDASEYRELVYNIFMSLYKKYGEVVTDDKSTKTLLSTSVQVLLAGLSDPAEDLQEKLLRFWVQDAFLSDSVKDRLLQMLQVYSPTVEDTFMPFLPLVLLALTTKSSNYDKKMFEPLQKCDYKDYEIAILWRTKNLSSVAPLFAPSLASQMTQMRTQAGSSFYSETFALSQIKRMETFDKNLEFRATQEPEFEPTRADDDPVFEVSGYIRSQYDGEFKKPSVPQPAHMKHSPRFLTKSTDVANIIREKEMKKNLKRSEMIREEVARQRSSVKLYRKYRTGDFPDVEITHSNLIVPLLELAKKDQLICKDLTVSALCSLLEIIHQKEGSHDLFKQITDVLEYILENRKGNNAIIAACLEIMIASSITDCSTEVVAKVSKTNGLHALGIFLLEKQIINGKVHIEPPKKKLRTDSVNVSTEWILLADLYKSLNNVDTVLSIFRNQIPNNVIQDASIAQTIGEWDRAKADYEQALLLDALEPIQEQCYQGLFECCNRLGCWENIECHITDKLQGNLTNIWNNPWKEWMLPWIFDICVHKVLDNDGTYRTDNDGTLIESLTVIETWLNDEEKLLHMKREFGEQMAVILLHDKQYICACDFLTNTLNTIKEEWLCLSPLSVQLRAQKVEKLRGISDVNAYVKSANIVDLSQREQQLNKLWRNSTPSLNDNLLLWDRLIAYRSSFASLIEEDARDENAKRNMEDGEEDSDFLTDMLLIRSELRLKVIETALYQKNMVIPKKHLQKLQQEIIKYPYLKHPFRLALAKYKHLAAEFESDAEHKLSLLISSWKHSHKVLQHDASQMEVRIAARQHISVISSTLAQLSQEDIRLNELIKKDNSIMKELCCRSSDIEELNSQLELYSFNNLKQCCNTSTAQIEECYYALSKYCYEKLSKGTIDSFLCKEFVHSTLKAMSCGSSKAVQYFPCLLKSEYLEDKETREIFEKESSSVETWRFLNWQAQLFSHLGTLISELVVPLLERIVESYPNAIVYTFHLAVETNPVLRESPQVYRIRKLLCERSDVVNDFLTAMHYIVQPELYLRYYLSEFLKNLSKGTATAVDILLKQVYSARGSRDEPRFGSIYSGLSKYKKEIERLRDMRVDDIKKYVSQLADRLRQSATRRKDATRLKDYSPWLHDLSESDLEIPGQYSGDRKPLPRYHAKIMKIEPTVKVIQSLRKPVRITMVGNDAKDYNFLVKFGEDLRLDQRLQQVFKIMNRTLNADATCKQRRLSIDTYQVIPLSKALGLIQWVEDTKPLQELIHFTLSKEEKDKHDLVFKEYEAWIQSAAPSKQKPEQYKEAVVKHSPMETVAKLNEFILKTNSDALRRAFLVLSSSAESFLSLRHNFVTTYATMCIAHWILGVGDRHLGNTLVTVHSGISLGIDFGLAFGAGIDQRVPELMPFRLTPQILGLLRPFTEKDLLRTTMIHTLRTLKNGKGPILACLDVFIHEPLNWTEQINKALKENNDEIANVHWLPQKKIHSVTRKLDGIKPCLITLEQLRDQHNDNYFPRYQAIVRGEDDGYKRLRAKIPELRLTSEEQVECLLDEATDLNLLGRTYAGWKPWL